MTILLFCAGAAEPDLSLLAPGRPALLVGVDAGAARLASAGRMPDCAVGDFDSAEPPIGCAEIVRLPAEKDDTDLEAALMHILPRYRPEELSRILILGALGPGRTDHLLANVWLAHQPRFAAYRHLFYFSEQGSSLRFLSAGCHLIAREPDKRYLSFIGLTPVRGLSLSQVKYPLQDADYAHPAAWVSNEFAEGADTMQCRLEEGLIAVVQSRDCV